MAPARARADEEIPKPEAVPLSSRPFATCLAEPAPQPFLSELPSVVVLRDGDREWRAPRARIKSGLGMGGLATGIGGTAALAAGVADMQACHDYFGLCRFGDTMIATIGGIVAAGGLAMLIVGSAPPAPREGVAWEPRPVLGVSPGSARLSVAF